MDQNQIHVLLMFPLTAIALFILFPLSVAPHTWRSKHRRALVFVRISAVMLLIAPIPTILWPIEDLEALVQSFYISMALLAPLWAMFIITSLYFYIVSLTNKYLDYRALTKFPETYPKMPHASGATATSGASKQDIDSPSNTGVLSGKNQNPSQPVVKKDALTAPSSAHASDLEDLSLTSSIRDEFEDLNDGQGRSKKASEGPASDISSETDADDAKLTDDERAVLQSIKSLDKKQLQRLVLDLQVLIESEQQAHDMARTLASDAIAMMRRARSNQKNAEKQTRFERLRRKKLEKQYKKAESALRDTMTS